MCVTLSHDRSSKMSATAQKKAAWTTTFIRDSPSMAQKQRRRIARFATDIPTPTTPTPMAVSTDKIAT